MSKILNDIKDLRNVDKLSESKKTSLINNLRKRKILTQASANTKTAKNDSVNFDSYILHLAPSTVSGYNMCPAASKGCAAACLNTAGRGRFDSIQYARIRKTLYFVKLKEHFLNHLYNEITNIVKKSKKTGKKVVVRLNGTSDIPWERVKLNNKTFFEHFPSVQFYDYTKMITRLGAAIPGNYHLTFSASESNDLEVSKAIEFGFNIAVVFEELPKYYLGLTVVDGDKHDFRFLDKSNCIVGLKAKGQAKKETLGFVKQAA